MKNTRRWGWSARENSSKRRKYYGVDLYFGSVLDFGFSKTAEETLSKWGHEAALEEMVRFFRRWRPTIIISKFQGNAGDGHGHHQAAGILTREAFRAAGDPQKFPDQIKQGLQPWQAKKLYAGSRAWADPSPGGGRETLSECLWETTIPYWVDPIEKSEAKATASTERRETERLSRCRAKHSRVMSWWIRRPECSRTGIHFSNPSTHR